MKSEEIRKAFIDYFEERDHRVVPGSSLVPNDPTLLLTSAGMVQFKPYFLREEEPPFARAASVQKCARTTDIESVGHTARHATFFEMLGNFSFGDYYKERAIPWAWELVTGVLEIDPLTLWISVFEDDDEAERIWKDTGGVDPARVIRLGAEENFWDMGPTGPCGPCSEMLYDRGPGYACGPACGPGCDCDRFLELWNLVFMQYNRGSDGSLEPLPEKNIDTGMGLERVAAIKQGVETVFEIDIIAPLIESLTEISGVGIGESGPTDVSLKVVADHARAATFLISDGVIPSNEGRGYILRRLIRRAVRHGRLIGIEGPFIKRLADVVVDSMGGAYPDLKEHHKLVSGVIDSEEERFGQTLEQGMELLGRVIDDHRSKGKSTIEGKTVFYLHDTLGFPLEVTDEIASEEGMKLDLDGFDALMEEQRERARLSREGETQGPAREYVDLCSEAGPSEFVGYGLAGCGCKVAALLADGRREAEVKGDKEVEVILDRTPFYAEMGGQIGDSGTIEGPSGSVEVEDTYYGAPGLIIQRGLLTGSMKEGNEVEARVNADRRLDIARNHSATHLLHWALRKVLGKHAKQSGSLVTMDRLRFDFTHFQAVTPGELAEIERLANSRVLEDIEVGSLETTLEEAKKSGAIALFGEKYGREVRVVEIGGFSCELCGGTHVERTGQIGPIRIVSESGIGAGLRRIEATSGIASLKHYSEVEKIAARAAELLKTRENEVPRKIKETLTRLKELERAAEREKSMDVSQRAKEIIEDAKGAKGEVLPRAVPSGGAEILIVRVDGEKPRVMRDLTDVLVNRGGFGVVAVAGDAGGKAHLVVKVSGGALEKGLDARELASAGGGSLGGGGGGRRDMAVAGGSRVEGIDGALAEVEKAAKGALEGGT